MFRSWGSGFSFCCLGVQDLEFGLGVGVEGLRIRGWGLGFVV